MFVLTARLEQVEGRIPIWVQRKQYIDKAPNVENKVIVPGHIVHGRVGVPMHSLAENKSKIKLFVSF